MSNRYQWALAACLAALDASAADPPAPDPLSAKLIQRLGAEAHPVCIVAAVVAAQPRVVQACSHAGAPVIERDSIFELGSLSKAFAGLLAADMVNRGEVALDDPASKYSPRGAKLPTRDGREITLRHLLTHTASLPAMPPGIAPGEFLKRTQSGDTAALYAALAATELERPIGGDVQYSNFGFLWLSDLLARAAGKPYDKLLAERILVPLGMKDTAVVLTPDQAKRRVPGHDLAYRPVAPLEFSPALAGAAGLNASMVDLVRFGEALALRRETPLADAARRALSPLHVFNDNTSVGYGWFLFRRPHARIAFHDGQSAGAYAAIAVNQDAQLAAIVLADSPVQLDDLALHLIDPSTPIKPPLPANAPKPPAPKVTVPKPKAPPRVVPPSTK